jgi:hypothetical protein
VRAVLNPTSDVVSTAVALTYKELRELSVGELEAIYDRTAPDVSVGLSFTREELARRESERKENRMLLLTWAIVVLTAVNVAVAVWLVLKT